jgi:hypothetical protein
MRRSESARTIDHVVTDCCLAISSRVSATLAIASTPCKIDVDDTFQRQIVVRYRLRPICELIAVLI